MKYPLFFSSACILAFCAGCASTNKIVITDPIGPAPFEQAGVSSEGTLQVFSAKEKALSFLVASDFFEKDQIRYESAHTDYAIHLENGELVKEVRNAQNRNDPNPTVVRLPAGQYRVIAEAPTGDGWTSTYDVPVVIKKGLKTVVHLEPDWRPAKKLENKSSLVRGDDGRILGWQGDK